MNNERIQEIKRRLAEATPGPWESVVGSYNETIIVGKKGTVMSFGGTVAFESFKGDEPNDDDEKFITWAPSDIAYLLSEVERLQTENERLSNEMDSMMISLEDRDPYAASKYWTYLLDEKNQLVEALRWYADDLNYKLGNQTILGEKARTALSHLKGE